MKNIEQLVDLVEKIGIDKLEQEGKLNNQNSKIFEEIKNSKIENSVKADITTFETQGEAVLVIVKKSSEENISNTEDFKQELINKLSLNNDVEINQIKIPVSKEELELLVGEVGTNNVSLSSIVTNVGGMREFKLNNNFTGMNGSGYSIVILDTGIDLDHSFFGPDANGDGIADRIIYTQDFTGEGDGTVNDVNGHGTHVASIAASSDGTYGGVASGANIIVLQVLNNSGSGGYGGIESALQWVIANSARYNIASVNMSLGSGENYKVNTPAYNLSDEFATLKSQNVMTVVAAGNSYGSYQSVGVSSPASDASVVSVGATYDAGDIAYFSQRGDLVEIFAPGYGITAARAGGGVVSYSGTSMASPFIAGLVATAQQIAVRDLGRKLTQDEFVALLQISGDKFIDSANSGTTYENVNVNNLAIAIGQINNLLLMGGSSNDILTTTNETIQKLYGFAGNDTLNGNSINNILEGGIGNDTLKGGVGNDTYIFKAGEGQDLIIDDLGANLIKLGVFNSSQISASYVDNDLVMRFSGSTDSITYKDFKINSNKDTVNVEFYNLDNNTTVIRKLNSFIGDNTAPISNNDVVTLNEDTGIIINVLQNDTDAQNHRLSIDSFTQPSRGTLVKNTNGTFTYTPNANYFGTDSFTYIAVDELGLKSQSATVTLTINSINDAPIVTTAIDNYIIGINEVKRGSVGASDVDGDMLSYSITTKANNGTLAVDTNGNWSYTANNNYQGNDSAIITISDGKGGSVTKTLNFIINNEISNNINTTATISVGGIFENIIDIARDEDWVKVSLVAGKTYDVNLTGISVADTYLRGIYDKNGVLISDTQNDDSNGTLDSYVKFTATYSGDYYISAGAYGIYTGTYRLEVKENNSNTPPIANNDSEIFNEDTSITIDVLANDTDAQGQRLLIDSYTLPSRGILIKNADGTFTYTPNENYYGTDSFTYIAIDESGLKSQSATVTLIINNINDKPILSSISQINTTKDSNIINGIFNAMDVDSTVLTYSTTLSVDGFTLNTDGTYSFNPSHEAYQSLKNGERKTIIIPISVSDGILNDTKDLVIKITGTNSAPVAVADVVKKVVQGEFLVNTNTESMQQDSSITGLNDGGYVITWESDQDGSGYGIYAQRYNKDGLKVGNETQINTYTDNNQSSPVITALNDGGYVIAWQSFGQDGSLNGIYAQKYSESGLKIGEETLVNTHTNSYQDEAAITGLNDGGYVITWSSSFQDGSGGGIYAQRYSSIGTKIGEETLVNSDTNNSQSNPAITGLNNGGYVIIWSSYGQDGSDAGIYGQMYNSLGVKVGEETQINTHTNSFQDSPSITALNNGGYVVTWRSAYQDGSGYGIYAQTYSSLGVKVGEETQINTYTTSDQENPSIAALNDGGYIIVWSSYAQDESGVGIYAQRYSSIGTKMGEEIQINSYTEDYQGSPSISALADGGYVIAWTSFNQDGGGYGIYARRFDKDGNKYQIDGGVLSTSENNPLIIDVLANDYDVDGDFISIKSVGDAMLNGKKVGETSIIMESGVEQIKFTPTDLDYLKEGEEATVSFNYTIVDIQGATSTATVTFNVTGTNDAPILSSIPQINTIEDANIINGTLIATDIDNSNLIYSTTIEINGFTLNENGTYRFNPAHSEYQSLKLGEVKTITIPISVSDGSLSDTKNLVIRVTGTNDIPTVITAVDNFTVLNNEIKRGSVGASDIDRDVLSYAITTRANNGILLVDTNGNWNYKANDNYVGNDRAIITVSDGKGGSVTKTLNFTVQQQTNDIANNINTTAVINVGGKFDSVIDVANDQDWIKVSLVAGKAYDVNLTGISVSDTYLRGIYNKDGVLISNTQNDDSNGTLNSYVKFNATYSGNYFISAGAYSNYTGTYRLEVQESNSSVITGNSNANILVGTVANNTIQALAGNDTITGGKGNDRLYGGNGNDTYSFVSGDGQDSIYDYSGTDNVVFNNTVSKTGVSIYSNGKDLSFQYTSQDNINISLWSNIGNKIEKFQLADGNYLSSTDIDGLIQSMTAYATNNGISLTSADDVRKNNELMTMIANSWHK